MTTITIKEDIQLQTTEFNNVQELYQALINTLDLVALHKIDIKDLSLPSAEKIKQSIQLGTNDLYNFQG